MANTRELRRRIKSVKNISQITRAMQMVAATKMRRAQNQAVEGRPYNENLSQALQRLLPSVETEGHPLLLGNESNKIGIILLSTDKGLVGALNTNLIRLLLASHAGDGNVVYYTVGKKGRSFVVRTGKELIADFENKDVITFRQAVQLSKLAIEAFNKGEIGQVLLVYPQFVSTIKQEAKIVKLLPIRLEDVILNEAQAHLRGETKVSSGVHLGGVTSQEFLFEPNVDALLEALLIHHIQTKIYQALLETKASEHSARMVAMKNATDNAKELVEDLNLTYNQTRQASITTELLEITTASIAME
ncbi:ATP synthase F1 subunit gamma [Candidatus Daviesbacteria bacterium]|nr:ATP synthase F1 subunit gamma [Candidatus Daviesbacteria bacterium]